jgi:prepilin-type N-terminal cleavage/methylation domain-containing protein
MRNRRGFSLVEILVVTVIVSILLSFAVAVLGPMRRGGRLSLACFKVSGTMRLARSMAIANNRLYSVGFQGTELRIWPTSGSIANPESVEILPDNISIHTPLPPAEVVFAQDGSCTPAWTVVLREDTEGDLRSVTLEPAIGLPGVAEVVTSP